MSDLLIDRVQQNLRRLRFVRAPEDLSEILAQAERESLSPLSVLDMVLDLEVASKEDRRIATSLKLASLPFVKRIDEYDCTFHPDLDKTQVMSLFDLTFLSRQENVLLLGPPGVGKTHLAVALAVKAAQAGHSIYFTTLADLVTTSNKGFAEWTELFEDPIIVAALLDRLLHHSVIVNIKGQSYRLRGKGVPVRKAAA